MANGSTPPDVDTQNCRRGGNREVRRRQRWRLVQPVRSGRVQTGDEDHSMPDAIDKVGRRTLITGAAMIAVAATVRTQNQPGQPAPATTLTDVPLAPSTTLTVERRGDIALVGFNRPAIQNRIDPRGGGGLGGAFYRSDPDPPLRALGLFGPGPDFSRGIDVDAMQAALTSGRRPPAGPETLDPLGKSSPRLSKPLVVVVH